MNKKADILFELGDPRKYKNNGTKWPDYLQYGFTDHDISELLRLVGDRELDNAPSESDIVWVPLHAWRTLGQLKTPKAVQPLIDMFDELHDDDWAYEELSIVLGMIGEASIEPLAKYISSSQHGESARIMALGGLEEIVRHHPDLRNLVIEKFQDYMKMPDLSSEGLNGSLIACLLNLNAVELIEDIQRMFKQDCVEIQCAGDLDDIEIELGLLNKRKTPRPHNGILPESFSQPLSRLFNSSDTMIARKTEKIGRNDPCPCGSGKKYKRCCLNQDPLMTS